MHLKINLRGIGTIYLVTNVQKTAVKSYNRKRKQKTFLFQSAIAFQNKPDKI